LWLLQSRVITTLFPVPEPGDDQLHAYLEVGHMQGMRQPVTPMGMSLLMYGNADWFEAYGVAIDPEHSGLIADIAGRLFIDLTPMLRDRRMRRRLPEAMGIYGPAVAASVGRLLDDPRFAARPDRAFPMDALIKIMMRTLPDLVVNGARAMIAPRRAQIRVMRRLDDFRAIRGPDPADPAERIDWCVNGQNKVLVGMMDLLPPLWTSMIARGLGGGLLRGRGAARRDRIDPAGHATQRDHRDGSEAVVGGRRGPRSSRHADQHRPCRVGPALSRRWTSRVRPG
jgi:rifampicin phosphotransferase